MEVQEVIRDVYHQKQYISKYTRERTLSLVLFSSLCKKKNKRQSLSRESLVLGV